MHYIAIAIEDIIESDRVNCVYIAFDQNKFVLSDLFITVNLFKYEKALCFLCKSKKKHFMVAFIKINGS